MPLYTNPMSVSAVSVAHYRGQHDCVKAESILSPFLQYPIAVVALFAATLGLTSVQVPLTLITAAFAWQSARTKVAPMRTLEFIAAQAASVN
jgi:hypothetical protein